MTSKKTRSRRTHAYPGEIEIQIYASPAERYSFETVQEIRRVDQPDVASAAGGAKIVWVNFPMEKSMPLPDGVHAILAP